MLTLFVFIASQTGSIIPLVDYQHSGGTGLSLPNQIISNYKHNVVSIYPCKHFIPADCLAPIARGKSTAWRITEGEDIHTPEALVVENFCDENH